MTALRKALENGQLKDGVKAGTTAHEKASQYTRARKTAEKTARERV